MGITTLGQSGTESNGNEGVLPHFLEQAPHYQMKFSIIIKTPFLEGGTLTSLQRIQSMYLKPCQQGSKAYQVFLCLYLYVKWNFWFPILLQ